ncbi:MAG: alpha-glucan family phosphorylase [Acidobacteria bacterium]|nr:alpha-glucan family phosphorylase [Acidobacteriota bacterium]MBI3265094.1 alpha-glucan family phosphorylase [Acidobacteriota bacterium]
MDSLPERISRLSELAGDLWWVWHFSARDVFRVLDYQLWRATAHNPVRMLRLLPPERLEQAAEDPEFLALYDAAIAGLEAARAAHASWWTERFGETNHRTIAYFSAEFALHQSLPIYAGGLGVLAGDTCKEANDLGLPFVGVGFMYPQGYFHQHLSTDGWQLETYERLDWADAPTDPAIRSDGSPCVVAVPLGDRTVLAAVWQVQVGRVRLYLLDTDLEENAPWDRALSARLYGGNQETRIQQEIILGLGGVRALEAMGISPAVWHLNEGHAAFVVLQRIKQLLEQGSSFDQAVEEVRRTTVFTTHTPVAAGHDAFPFHLVETHLAGAWGTLGQYRERFMALGLYDNGGGPLFNMTALALRVSGAVNAVSRLHAQVTTRMWQPIWETASDAGPRVRAITNGVHVPTWVAPDLSKLFEKHLGFDWRERYEDPAFWDRVVEIPDAELWSVRRMLRTNLFAFVRERARQRWTQDRVSAAQVVAVGMLLDPDALTIGFARRFTGYKRPELIFSDPDRLARILGAAKRPVQIVFAGKAHPADDVGKGHLQRVFHRAVDPTFGGRIAFVDDYDLHVAHFLVQGCDVWLNNPRKPLEASGTSGMKAAMNGVPHLSIGDGWWAEGYNGSNGWLIEGRPATDDPAAVDVADADALYRLLEEQVVPAFYDRDRQDVPHRWLPIVREAIRSVVPRFSTRRMVKEYVESMYEPALQKVTTE